MQRIKNLKVKWFRGIVDTELGFDGKSVILFGENGQGKSSFVDAIEFLFKGEVSHLEQAQTTSTSKHAPHILSYDKKENCEVEIEFQDESKIKSIFKKGLSDIPQHIQPYFQQGKSFPFILRRKNLLDFVLAQPAPRYEQLAALIKISDLESVELALMHKRDELKDLIGRTESELKYVKEQSHKLFGKEFDTDKQLLELINNRLKQDDQSTLNSFEEIQQRKTEIVSKSKSPDEMQKATEIKQALEGAKQIKEKLDSFEKHKVFWQQIESLQSSKEKVRELMFKQLLELGRNLLQETDLNSCPLCLQLIQRNEVLEAIRKRLESLEHITKQVNELRSIRSNLKQDLEVIINNSVLLSDKLKKFSFKNDIITLYSLDEKINHLTNTINQDILRIEIEPFEEIYRKISNEAIEEFLKESVRWLQNEQNKLAPTERDKVAIQLIDLLTKASALREKFIDLSEKLRNESLVFKQINTIYDCFLETKHTEVQNIYDELQNDVSNYYQILHPREEHRDIKLVVNTVRRGSAEIKSKFYNREDEDPRGFYSEAHLDSLGLCIFLAFVKHFNKDFPLIILDDVVSSIDAVHRNRISELIYEKFKEYQFLITTHDYIWFEELHAAQRAYKIEGNFKNYKIIKWSLIEGPIIDKHKPRWEDIETKIANGDKEEAARAGRQALEWLCYEMNIRLIVSVTLKRDGKYEVKDLHPPFIDRIKKLIPDFYTQNEIVFKNLERNVIFGNISSHNNPLAGSISIEEVKDFIESLRKVHDLFFCKQCQNLVEYHQSAKLVKCKCNNGKMWNTK